MIRALRTIAMALATFSSLTIPATAFPMATEACEQAKSEQLALETTGVADDMAQGPDWARTNLSVDRLQRVARWIELQEQILFRCPRPAPPQISEAATAPLADVKSEKDKQLQKIKAKPAEALSEIGISGEDRPVKPKPPAAKKPKAEDAYRSPTPLPSKDVQHAVPGAALPATGGANLAR